MCDLLVDTRRWMVEATFEWLKVQYIEFELQLKNFEKLFRITSSTVLSSASGQSLRKICRPKLLPPEI